MDWENEFIANIITSEVPGKPMGIEIFGLAERRYRVFHIMTWDNYLCVTLDDFWSELQFLRHVGQ